MNIYDLIEQVKQFEGFRVDAYKCPAGVLTIGYGRTTNVHAGDKTTKEKEDQWIASKVKALHNQVSDLMIVYGLNMTPKQLYALTDFAYNCGMGNLRKLCDGGKRDKKTICEKILLYNKAGGKVLKGLSTRRKWEHDLFKEDL